MSRFYENCENIAQILGKYYTNNVQILYKVVCKYCTKQDWVALMSKPIALS